MRLQGKKPVETWYGVSEKPLCKVACPNAVEEAHHRDYMKRYGTALEVMQQKELDFKEAQLKVALSATAQNPNKRSVVTLLASPSTFCVQSCTSNESDVHHIQAVRVLKSIDTIVAQGGPPGQKDQDLLEVQQHLQKTRDAFTAAKRQVEDINVVHQYHQSDGAENKHPNHTDPNSVTLPSVHYKLGVGQSPSTSPRGTLWYALVTRLL
eukprot:1645794-Pyramimonas_sp.AAC.3